MAKPATELKTATAVATPRVSSSAATAWGSVTAPQKAAHPPLKAFVSSAASGSSTRSDR